jgi:hypothetical protein
MRTADLVIFEIEQRLFETLITTDGWFSPPKLGWEIPGSDLYIPTVCFAKTLNPPDIQIPRVAFPTTRLSLQ